MLLFLIIAAVGIVLLLAGMLFGDALEAFDAGPFVSLPVVGAVLTAFGGTAAVVVGSTSAGSAVAAVAGVAGGVVFGVITGYAVRALMRMPTDHTPRASDVVGESGVVVTPIRAGGYGEVRLRSGGVQLKVAATASEAVPIGTTVLVIEAPSPTSIVVVPLSV